MEATLDRRMFVKGGLAAALCKEAFPAAYPKPNIVFIMADEWRAQALNYSHDVNAHTPTLDRLAQESVNFTDAISGLPVCSPFRASLMTGQYPLTNGVFINDVPLEPKGVTLGEAFSRAGYRTGYIGKWHLYGSPAGHHERRQSYIPRDKRFGFEYWKVGECSHDYNHSLYYDNDDPNPKYWPGYDAFAQTNDACHFIANEIKARQPFFLALSLGPPHFSIDSAVGSTNDAYQTYKDAPEQYQALYRTRELQLRANVPTRFRKVAKENLKGYYAHIAALDECIKQVLETLDRSGAKEDTIVIFTSDHGDMMLSQGLTTKLYPWEESLRVPFVLRYPRKLGSKGRKLRAPLNAPDIMPTLLGLCGIPEPEGIQGTNYSKLLFGQTSTELPTSAFINLPVSFIETRRYGFAPYRGVRTDRYTYVRSLDKPWLLYDNERDPYQMHNLCGHADIKSIQAELELELRGWLARVQDEFLPGEDYLKRYGLTQYEEVNSKKGRSRSPWGDWESTMD